MTVVDEVAFDVERGKIKEFATATLAEDPVHTDPEAARAAGFEDVLATPTHVVVAGHHRDQRGFVDKLGLAYERVVVGSVTWTYLRPVLAGDRLTAVRRVVDDVRKKSLRIVTLETEYTDQHGEAAVRVREALIERGAQS
ncbi:FAS1-like dehydratase domain-containing protein [Amycolatopsis acididurans]|uniref:FAS1-like dehydratase domain-containing protein n=1 Tax=Amycolatopsis acididurans TaxID=2724524 RepID=UPI0028AA90E9|nr:MaoC family dehydratase N-terminal domain-containing protein [Amycolatopsis acididurans]